MCGTLSSGTVLTSCTLSSGTVLTSCTLSSGTGLTSGTPIAGEWCSAGQHSGSPDNKQYNNMLCMYVVILQTIKEGEARRHPRAEISFRK